MGGDLILYSRYFITSVEDITTANLIINSTISITGARYICCEIKNFYLLTPLNIYKYIRIIIDILPEDIIVEYNLMNLAHKGYIYYKTFRRECTASRRGYFRQSATSPAIGTQRLLVMQIHTRSMEAQV